MATLHCVCLCLCVSLVVGQFGFFPSRETPRFGQGFLNPSRIRDRLTGILHLQRETPSSNPEYVYPFNPNNENSRPGSEYGRPSNNYDRPDYNYGRPSNNYDRPDYNYGRPEPDYGRPATDYNRPGNDNWMINQNQFGVPNRNDFQDTNTDQNGFTEAPNFNGFTNGQNGFQEYPSNSDANSNEPTEEKRNEDTLIVIPGDAPTNNGFFGSSDGFAFPDSKYESTKTTEATTRAPEATTKAPEETTKAPKETTKAPEETTKAPEETTVSPASPEFPPLTPVPSTDSRNNFNFGPSGIFQETCQTVDNEIGSCIDVSQCQPYLKLIQESRSNPNALRILRQAHCGFQGSNPKVCCPRPGIPTGPPPTLPPPTTTTQGAMVMPVEPQDPEPKTATVFLPEAPVCGLSNASFSRVVGGVDAKLGDFPWMALLGYKPRRGGTSARWLCGGSLISARHVLTAAHCIHNMEDDLYLVRLGELDLAREDEGAAPVDVPIKISIKHEEYNPKAFTNDIGILVLNRNVQFTDLIKPICIPRSSELRARSYENYNPLIAGWGDTEFRGPAATHLQVLQLPVVSNEFCASAYSAYKAQVIDHRVLCAGYKKGGKDACQGDSGGPLMQPIWNSETLKTYFYQIGVVSYGKKCAEAGFPGVYSRVTNFVPWIEDTVAKN